MMLLGMGLAFFFGKPYIQPSAPMLPSISLGFWSDVPQIRAALEVNALFFVGVVVAAFLWWAFASTRAGLVVRIVGDSADAARAMGYPVDLVRFLATAAGGFLAGLGGAYLSLYYPGSWNERISSGQGLMAVALVIFARWNPLRCLVAALLFGGAGALGPGAPGDRRVRRLLSVLRRALRADLGRDGADRLAGPPADRRARRAVGAEIARRHAMSPHHIEADPYPWPWNGALRPDNTALIVIDMQTDFCGRGGYVDKMGYDLSLTRAPIAPIARLLAAMRPKGYMIIHTREGPSARPQRPAGQQALALGAHRRRDRRPGAAVRPHPGARRAGLGDHPRAGARAGRDRHRQAGQGLVLRHRSRIDPAPARHRHILLTGITTDVCVHTTMREANDRGFECLLLEDCCGATDHGNHLAAIKMIKMQGGVFGAVSGSAAVVAQLP